MLNVSPVTAVKDSVTIPDIKRAVAAAIKAYAETGSMQDAALAYAAHGVPVFPVRALNKSPVPQKLEDADGNPIFGTGGFKRATCDPDQIREWWTKGKYRKRREHLIGVPMGPASGVWCADIDTKSGGHDNDGMAPWLALQATHGAIKTRQHRTASDGLHEFFAWDDQHPITSRRGGVPRGIDIKGVGGYVVMPPSKRKGRDYVVTNDVPPKKAPAWLYELIGRAPVAPTVIHNQSTPRNIYQQFALEATSRNSRPLVDIDELADVMKFVPNPDLDFDEWTAIGLALYISTGGSDRGFQLFDEFSQKASKYDAAYTAQRWEGFKHSPPNRTGPAKLYKIAIANGWTTTAPTHALANSTSLSAARADIARHVSNFFRPNIWQRFADEACGAAVNALRVDTGAGKTTITIEELQKAGLFFHYAVPTRKLAAEFGERFRDKGVNVRVAYGREAPDPDSPGDAMCLEPDKVKLAVENKIDVTKACCKAGGKVCPSFDVCGYQKQWRDTEGLDGWIFAADFVFHRQDAMGTADVVIFDEGFWQKQLRGIDPRERISLLISFAGKKLGDVLDGQPEDGPLRLKHAIYAGDLDELIRQHWEMMPDVPMHPDMNAHQLKAHIKKHGTELKHIAYLHCAIKVLEELRDMIQNGIAVSGRLRLGRDKEGMRVIEWRGVASIKKQFQQRTLMLDATLPDLNILQVSHPRVEKVADISVAIPDSVRIRQIRNTPTSKTKLATSDAAEKHQDEILRYILQRFIETGRKPSLVIMQKQVEESLEGKLPPEIAIEHFNDIAGLDQYRDVRLLILIGRPQPGPEAVETIAATLSGEMPECVGNGDGAFAWYPSVRRGIRMKDGSGVAVMGDEHPDALCEAVREQITESELLQGIGRGRAVNRDASSRLDIDLLFDVVLPIEVDEDERWQRPSLFISTAIDGVMLTSKADLMKIWPQLFADKNVADRTIAKGVPTTLPGFESVRYRPAVPKAKWRTAYFDRSLIPDPGAWLGERLGPVQVER